MQGEKTGGHSVERRVKYTGRSRDISWDFDNLVLLGRNFHVLTSRCYLVWRS